MLPLLSCSPSASSSSDAPGARRTPSSARPRAPPRTGATQGPERFADYNTLQSVRGIALRPRRQRDRAGRHLPSPTRPMAEVPQQCVDCRDRRRSRPRGSPPSSATSTRPPRSTSGQRAQLLRQSHVCRRLGRRMVPDDPEPRHRRHRPRLPRASSSRCATTALTGILGDPDRRPDRHLRCSASTHASRESPVTDATHALPNPTPTPAAARAQPTTRARCARFAGDRSGVEDGYVLILTVLLLLPLLAFTGFAVDLGAWTATASKAQNAADAASLAGVVYLPDLPAKATSVARRVRRRNGYTNGVDGVTVTAAPNARNELEVTIFDPNVRAVLLVGGAHVAAHHHPQCHRRVRPSRVDGQSPGPGRSGPRDGASTPSSCSTPPVGRPTSRTATSAAPASDGGGGASPAATIGQLTVVA